MSLSLPLVAAILFAALLHAGWNALIKSGGDKSLDTALIHSLGIFFAVPALLWFGLPPAAYTRPSWPHVERWFADLKARSGARGVLDLPLE